LAICAAIGVLLLVIAVAAFRRMEQQFADVV